MALRNILEDKEPTLRKISKTVEVFDKKLWQLLEDMADTMYAAEGVGLAAPQVGILKRVVVIDIGEGIIELINPEITYMSEVMIEGDEGCLSSPGEYGIVPRPEKVIVKGQNRHGEPVEYTAEGFLARAVCHEVDHLKGVLFKDLVTQMYQPKKVTARKVQRKG